MCVCVRALARARQLLGDVVFLKKKVVYCEVKVLRKWQRVQMHFSDLSHSTNKFYEKTLFTRKSILKHRNFDTILRD